MYSERERKDIRGRGEIKEIIGRSTKVKEIESESIEGEHLGAIF